MILRQGFRSAWAILAFAAAFVPPGAAFGQGEPVPFGMGNHAFRFILNELQLQPLHSIIDALEAPDRTLVIVLGDLSVLNRLPHGLTWFTEHGGAVLLATDRPDKSGPNDPFQVRVVGELIVANDPNLAYRGELMDCPLVTEFQPGHPLFEGITRIATNRPSYLDAGKEWSPECHVAWFTTNIWTVGKVTWRLPPVRIPFAAAKDVGKGRMLVLADHSIFINDMMMQPDNDNFNFASKCVLWLTDGGRRDRVLFVDEGVIVRNFQVRVKEPPLPNLSVAEINQLLGNLESKNVFNRLLLGRTSPIQWVVGALLVCTLGLLLLGGFRLLKARHRIEAEAPLFGKRVARLQATVALIHQRHQAMLEEGNLWEAAREVARACFPGVPSRVVVSPTSSQGAPLHRPPGLPRVTAHGSWRQRWVLKQRVAHLWNLAFGTRPVRISPREFTQLLEHVEDVKAALAQGLLQLDGAEIKPS